MAATTPTTLRGLLIPDPRITSARIWAAESSYTEAGPIPGVAEAQQTTGMALVTSGTQSSGTIDVRALRGGGVGTAALVWKQSTDSDWMGWDPPGVVSAFRTVSYETGTAEAGARWPHAVTLSDGRVVVAYCRSLGGTSSVRTRTIAADGTIAAAVSVQSQTTSGTLEMRPALVVLPSGRLVIFYFTFATSSWAIASEYSDDGGATWTLQNARATAGPGASATYVPNFLRAAYSGGQIVVIAGYVDGSNRNVRQWASIDQGCTLTLVSTYTSTSYDLLSGDIVPLDGGGFLAALWVYLGSNDYAVRSVRIGSAFSSLSDQWTTSTGTTRVDVVSVTTAGTRDYGWVALVKGDDEKHWCILVARNADNTVSAQGDTLVTQDEGRTWSNITEDLEWFESAADTAYPSGIAATWHQGRVLLYGNADQRSALPTNGNSLYEWALGGYSTVTTPTLGESPEWRNIAGYDRTWFAIEDPTSNGYTAAGTGTSAFNASVEAWEVSATSPDTKTLSLTPAFSDSSGYGVRAILRGDAGSTSITLGDAGADYEVRVSISVGSPTRLFLTDVQASSTLAQPTVSSATWYEVMVWVQSGKASAWYRPAYDTAAKWVALATNQTLTAGTVSADHLTFGAVAGTTTTGYWRAVRYAYSYAGLVNIPADGFTNPTDLRPRPTAATPVYLTDGVSVAARGGTAATGDEWDIETEHTYSVDRIHPREWPSPSQGWRSTGTSAETIAWKLTDETTGGYESDLWGLYLDATNIPQGKLQYTTVTTPTWQDASSFNLYEEFSGVRSGSVVMPDTGASAVLGRYIERDELVGGSVKLSSGDVRNIIRNEEGYLSAGTVGKRVRIYLDESQVDATDGTSGTFELRYPRGLFVFNSRWASSQGPLVGLRIAINTAGLDAPPEGYWKTGIAVLGPMAVFGTQYSATRRRVLRGNTSLVTAGDGRRRAVVNGPPRQVVDFAWTEGVDEVFLAGTTQDDYVLPASGREPVAAKHDTVRVTWGLARELEHGAVPVVYVPEITSGTGSTPERRSSRAGGAVYGRALSDPEAEALLGDEFADELNRGSMSIEEEL